MSNAKKGIWRNFNFKRWMKLTLSYFILAIVFNVIWYSIDSDESVSSVFQANTLLRRFLIGLVVALIFTLAIEPRQKADPSSRPE